MFEISKEFSFDYGHRVHTQKLNQKFSIDNQCVCRHLHGHRGTIKVTLIGEELEDTQMLTDFKHLNWLKKFIDENLDHKMIMDMDDPTRSALFPLSYNSEVVENSGGCRVVQRSVYEKLASPIVELYEGLVLVNFCPTSENFAKWIYGLVKEKMSPFMNITSLKIQFSETPKTTATYYE